MSPEANLKNLRLNPRLAKIAEQILPCRCIADIGTDHAYIPIRALLCGTAKSAIASDINRGPIDRARANAQSFGLLDKLSLRLGSGLETVSPGEADTIVIAGMGGILISDILESSIETARSADFLILQPMTAAKELREYLCSHDFEIESEVLVAEDQKIYNILCVKPCGKTEYSPKEMILGRGLEEASPELYPRYFAGIERKLKIRLEGLKSSALPENRQQAELVEKQLRLIGSRQ